MSVKDFDKNYSIKDMCTGEVITTVYHDMFDYDSGITYKCFIGDVLLLRYIHDCIDNNHGCLISIGYKNK